MKRLERMNEMLESLSDGAWICDNETQTLAKRLKLSKYYPAIRSKMLDTRLMQQPTQPRKDSIDCAAADPNLQENSIKCGGEISDEVSTLQILEDKTSKSVHAMLASLSGDIPICSEEAEAILSRVKATFDPARKALSAAVRSLAAEKDSHSTIARYDVLGLCCSRIHLTKSNR